MPKLLVTIARQQEPRLVTTTEEREVPGVAPGTSGRVGGLLRNLLQQLICLLYQRRCHRRVDGFAVERGILQDLDHLTGEGISLGVEADEIVLQLGVSRVIRIARDQRRV